MFLNAGTVFLMHLSIHTSSINFQSERNSKVDSVDFAIVSLAIKTGRTIFATHLMDLVMHHHSGSV